MRPAPGDDEVNGAAAALLGLHSSNRTPPPRPTPTPPRPAPASEASLTSRPPPNPAPLEKHHTYPNPWNSGNFRFDTPTAPPGALERARSDEHQPRSAPVLTRPGGRGKQPYSYYATPAAAAYFDLPVRAGRPAGDRGFATMSSQDPTQDRNHFLGGPLAAAAAAAAAGAWIKPINDRQQQHQRQYQSMLTPKLAPSANAGRPSMASFVGPSVPVRTGAPWFFPPSTGGAPPLAVQTVAAPHDHQHEAPYDSATQPPRPPQTQTQQHAAPLRLERSTSVASGLTRPVGGVSENGDYVGPTVDGQDRPQAILSATTQRLQKEKRELLPPPPRPIQLSHHNFQQKHHEQQQRYPTHEQQQQQQQQTETQRHEKPSINKLWSLIPGLRERRPEKRNDEGDNIMLPPYSKRSRGGAGNTAGGRWYPADVHPPLSDSARRHRARALARLRARRRAMAAATAAAAVGPPKPSSLSRFTSNASTASTDSSDSGGGGVVETNDEETSGAASGGASSARNTDEVAVDGTGAGDSTDLAISGGGGGSGSGSDGGGKDANGAEGALSKAVEAAGNNSSSSSSATGSSSKVGDLFELMRNVSANAAAAALAAEGGESGGGGGIGSAGGAGEGRSSDGGEVPGESRELGKPVKYKYRQEAARSRKRTRGRFVSEKAPAFVSITELMALRRAERERQQKQEAHTSPAVVSGVGAG